MKRVQSEVEFEDVYAEFSQDFPLTAGEVGGYQFPYFFFCTLAFTGHSGNLIVGRGGCNLWIQAGA